MLAVEYDLQIHIYDDDNAVNDDDDDDGRLNSIELNSAPHSVL